MSAVVTFERVGVRVPAASLRINDKSALSALASLRAIDADIEWVLSELAQSSRSLARTLNDAADGIEDGTRSTVNSLGIVQGQGPAIDVLCGRLRSLIDSARYVRAAALAIVPGCEEHDSSKRVVR